MKISVIMPSFNQARYVEASIRSIINQDYEDKEILFIDGGSTDKTMKVVEKYRDKFAYCVSERDKGQSDALHKGFTRATGDVLTWLNTDDLLLPGALREVANTFASDARCDCVFGNIIWMDEVDRILRCRKGERYLPLLTRLGRLTPYGPSAFFKRDLYGRVGGVDLGLHYLMDTDLWWRFAISGARFARLRRYTWGYRLHRDAKTSAPMFSEAPDASLIKAMEARRTEVDRIGAMTKRHSLALPGILTTALQSSLRATSPNYLASLYDSWRLRGHHINEAIETQ
ncbi:glycosyltransferase [Mesorhizobium sp. M0814]|uniref:glycosyltransferase family 2 protein n=1 Tax=unclassified Mesorhizobium TaxID=325217 RepID=UPI00333B5055